MERARTTVKIVEVCKVAPPPVEDSSRDDQYSTSPRSLPLTFFDLLWLRFTPVQRIFFYEFPTLRDKNTNTTLFFHSEVVPRLKHSLSLTLRHFPPLAGNLTWPESSHKPIIVYTEGDSVLLTVAESNADFNRISGSEEFFEAIEYHPLVPNLAISHQRAAALAIQVTLFPNSGFSIGMVTHHAILDGKTVHLFLKSWTLTCRSCAPSSADESSSASLPPELKPLYDRNIIKDPAGLETIYAKHWLDLEGPNNRSLICWEKIVKLVPSDLVRGTLKLTRANIERLRQSLENNHKQEKEQHYISTFTLTYAYALVCLLRAEGIIGNNKDEKAEIFVCFAADFRPRLDPPVPPTYFGNCLGGRAVTLETKRLVETDFGLAMAVKIIGEAIKSLEIKGVLNGAEHWLSQHSSAQNAARIYSTAGSPRFENYNTDFGWGKPRKMDMVSIDRTGAISFSDTRDGDGVEIGLALKKHHMEAFASLFSQGLVNS